MKPIPKIHQPVNAEQLNHSCHCISLNRSQLRLAFSGSDSSREVYRIITEQRQGLFAESAVFINRDSLNQMLNIIKALEQIIAMPAYQQLVLDYAPEIAHFPSKAFGVFMGYDFHLSEQGAKLIEINTNAGGALLNTKLINAQLPCCDKGGKQQPGLVLDRQNPGELEQKFMAMFYQEWQLERGLQPLLTIAIVDEQPENQYLFPEFLLFQQLFEQNNITAVICEPSQLVYRDASLYYDQLKIDLIYNRLTDFSLQTKQTQAIHQAYLDENLVLTPNPRSHALYANKFNMVLLSNTDLLQRLGVDSQTINILHQGIAQTIQVYPESAETLWADRKQLFFKPARGYGGKAAYRGDKITRGVFNQIIHQDYVAQALVTPSYRQLEVNHKTVALKLDLRHYVYQGQTQLISARLYQGQTTNFRTLGGGFAQVVVVDN